MFVVVVVVVVVVVLVVVVVHALQNRGQPTGAEFHQTQLSTRAAIASTVLAAMPPAHDAPEDERRLQQEHQSTIEPSLPAHECETSSVSNPLLVQQQLR